MVERQAQFSPVVHVLGGYSGVHYDDLLRCRAERGGGAADLFLLEGTSAGVGSACREAGKEPLLPDQAFGHAP